MKRAWIWRADVTTIIMSIMDGKLPIAWLSTFRFLISVLCAFFTFHSRTQGAGFAVFVFIFFFNESLIHNSLSPSPTPSKRSASAVCASTTFYFFYLFLFLFLLYVRVSQSRNSDIASSECAQESIETWFSLICSRSMDCCDCTRFASIKRIVIEEQFVDLTHWKANCC